MSALSIQPTYPIFTETDGQPLENGYIWIGTANLDPQTNPINVFWDAALTIPADQPIRTLGGYPSNSGTPARLYVNSDYSIRVMNKNGSVVYSAPEATERFSSFVLTSIDATSIEYQNPAAGSVPTTVNAKLESICVDIVVDFGADPTGSADSTAAIQAAIDSLPARGGCVRVPPGTYRITSTINVGDGNGSNSPSTKNGVKIIGAGAGFAVSGALVPTIFDYQGATTTSPILNIRGQISDCEVSGIFFACNGNSGGISATSFSGCDFNNLKIVNPASNANGFSIFGGGAPTGNYNIFNKFRQINIALLSPSSNGLFMDGDYSVQNDTWISHFELVRVENVLGATNSVCAWFKFVDSCTFTRCHFDNKPEPVSFGVIFDALANDGFPVGMGFYDCSVHETSVIEDMTHKIRKNMFYNHGTYDNEIIPTHPLLCGITDAGEVFGDFLYNADWESYAPTVTSTSGALTTVAGAIKWIKLGKIVYLQCTVFITDNGTGSQAIRVTLPPSAGTVSDKNFFCIGRNTVTGGSLSVQIAFGSQLAFIRKYDDTYPGASGASLEFSGFYEVV